MTAIEALAKSLTDILSDEKTVYEQMLGISEEIKDMIVEGDPDELAGMIDEETALAEKAAELDKERTAISESLTIKLGLSGKPSLSELCALVEDPGQKEALIRARRDLNEVLRRLMDLNKKNQELLAQKRDYIGAMMDAILTTEQVGTTYDSKGSSEIYSGSAGLFDRQV